MTDRILYSMYAILALIAFIKIPALIGRLVTQDPLDEENWIKGFAVIFTGGWILLIIAIYIDWLITGDF